MVQEEGGKANLQALSSLPKPVAEKLEYVRDLWSAPQTTQRILDKLNNPDSKVDQVAADIEKDPGLTFQLLRIVNSAFYAIEDKITSARRAISMLGYATTKHVVLVQAMISKMGQERAGGRFDVKESWKHSMKVGHAASLFARAPKEAFPDENFTAGLLHDVGKLVEYQYLQEPFKHILDAVEDGKSFVEAEKEILQTTHAEIGACICACWGMPPVIVESVRHHLDTDAVLDSNVAKTVKVVATMCGFAGRFNEDERDRWADHWNEETSRFDQIIKEAGSLVVLSMQDIFALK